MAAMLHVVLSSPRSCAEAAQAIRALRHLCGRQETLRGFLLLCALPDAPGERMPGDAPLIRALQSGVMAMNARSSCRFDLLILRRRWDGASRAYTGFPGMRAIRRIVSSLLMGCKPDAALEAVTLSAESFRQQYGDCDSILFSDLSLACTPDTPTRMLAALRASGSGCVCARVLFRQPYPQSVLARLCAAGFSLSPLRLLQEGLLARSALSRQDMPRLYTQQKLHASLHAPDAPVPIAAGCAFIRMETPTLSALLLSYRQDCLQHPCFIACLPVLQLALLLAAAFCGFPLLAAAALLAPEIWALCHPSQLPGLLVRIALLPALAAHALDALLMRLTANTRFLRLRMPPLFLRASGCAIFGALLLAAALSGAQALPALLPVALLWLAAPLLHPALDGPTLARIPLDADQHALLRIHAESLYFAACAQPPSPSVLPLRMLCEAAGCMMKITEPDEAARRIEKLLVSYPAAALTPASAVDQAAMLCCAQAIREHMSQCDAALRALPGEIEARVLSCLLPDAADPLGAFLSAARSGDAALFSRADIRQGDPLSTLFLPLAPAREMARHALTLPLTHPHTFLRQLERENVCQKEETADLSGRFLSAAAAAMSHPFYPLLMRSPVTAPYAALLAQA